MSRSTDVFDTLRYVNTYQYGPYNPSIASSASSSMSSVWSDAGSQSSDDSSIHSGASDSEQSEAYCQAQQYLIQNLACNGDKLTSWSQPAVAPIHHQHPRRTTSAPRNGPPSLVRQCDRKVNFVDGLVGREYNAAILR